MSEQATPREVARRVLPWVLLTKFRNVVMNLPLSELKPGRHEIRNIEYYVTTTSPEVHVPAASSLLYIPFIKFSYDVMKDSNEVVIKDVSGIVRGYFYDGTSRGYRIENLEEEVRKRTGRPTTLTYEDSVSKFDIEGVLRAFYRLEAGKLFAAHLSAHSRKKDGITFSNLGRMKNISVVVEERGVSITVDLKVSVFEVCGKGVCFKAPGVVPGLLYLLHAGLLKPLDGEAADVLNSTIKTIANVGDRLSPVSGGILQSTNKARFIYVVGELDEKNEEEGRRRRLAWDLIRGVRVSFYANERTGGIEMVVTMYPFNPPAIIVMNYPPFNLAPISALLKDRYWQLKRLADKAYQRLKSIGLDGAVYIREMTSLADAGITIYDVKTALREGYPRIETIEKMLSGFEKVGRLGDIMSLAIGRVEKVDKLLVTFLGMEEESKKTVAETEEKGKEEEEIML